MKECLKLIQFIVIMLFVLLGWQKVVKEVSGKKGITALEIALQAADENKEELKKVLYRYQKNPIDSLKYKAACFLIENMLFYSLFPLSSSSTISKTTDEFNLDAPTHLTLIVSPKR